MPKKASRRSKVAARRPKEPLRRKLVTRSSITTRLLEQGTPALSDVELVSLFLLPRSAECGPYEESERLLTEHGSVRNLLSSRPPSTASDSLLRYNFAMLQAVLELARRHYRETMVSKPALVSSQSVVEYARSRLRDLKHEVFGCVFLDSCMRVQDFRELFRGSIEAVNVHIGEVARIALSVNAAGVIAVHNHPTGFAEPSSADRSMSLQLRAALNLVDVQLFDHLIIGDGTFESLANRGLL